MDYVYSKNGWQIDSFVPWRGRLWGVCNTHLHVWSNSCREKDSINSYSIDTYRADESFAHCHGHLCGVCNTLLHRYTENGSFRVGRFNGESNFWSVRVGAYGIRPSVYQVFGSMDYVYSKNGWQIDPFVPWRGRLWGVCNTPLHRYPENGSLRVGCFNGESNFCREKDSTNTY